MENIDKIEKILLASDILFSRKEDLITIEYKECNNFNELLNLIGSFILNGFSITTNGKIEKDFSLKINNKLLIKWYYNE